MPSLTQTEKMVLDVLDACKFFVDKTSFSYKDREWLFDDSMTFVPEVFTPDGALSDGWDWEKALKLDWDVWAEGNPIGPRTVLAGRKPYMKKYFAFSALAHLLYLALLADIGVVEAKGEREGARIDKGMVEIKLGIKNGAYLAGLIGSVFSDDDIDVILQTSIVNAAREAIKAELKKQLEEELKAGEIDEEEYEDYLDDIEDVAFNETNDLENLVNRLVENVRKGYAWTDKRGTWVKIALPAEVFTQIKQLYAEMNAFAERLEKAAKYDEEAEKRRKDLEWSMAVGFETLVFFPHVKRKGKRKEQLKKWQTSAFPLIAYWAKKEGLNVVLRQLRYAYKRIVDNRDEIRKMLKYSDIGERVLRHLNPDAWQSLAKRAYARLKNIEKNTSKYVIAAAVESAATAVRMTAKSVREGHIKVRDVERLQNSGLAAGTSRVAEAGAYIAAFLSSGEPLPHIGINVEIRSSNPNSIFDSVIRDAPTAWSALKFVFPGIDEIVKMGDKGRIPNTVTVKSVLAPKYITRKNSGCRIAFCFDPINPHTYLTEVKARRWVGGLIMKNFYAWLKGKISFDDFAKEFYSVLLELSGWKYADDEQKVAILKTLAGLPIGAPSHVTPARPNKGHERLFKRLIEETDRETLAEMTRLMTSDTVSRELVASVLIVEGIADPRDVDVWNKKIFNEVKNNKNIRAKARRYAGIVIFGYLLNKKIKELAFRELKQMLNIAGS